MASSVVKPAPMTLVPWNQNINDFAIGFEHFGALLASLLGREGYQAYGLFGAIGMALFSTVVVAAIAALTNPRGIRLMSQPGQGTPVATGRGLNQGDIVVSINDVPVRGKEDILGYLRGDGQGLARYRVRIESEGGLQRTVVYQVDRRGRPNVSG